MTFRNLDKTYWLSIVKISALWCLPIWAFVIVDAYRIAEGLPDLWEPTQFPGFVLSLILDGGGLWSAMHDSTWTEICIYSCLFYFVIVALLVMSWRKIRKSRAAQDPK